MLRRHADAAPLGPPNHHRNGVLAAQHEAELRGLVDQHVHGEGDEIEDLDLDHRAKARDRGPDPAADETGFRNRSVPYPFRTELLHEPFRRPEDPAGRADVLAHDDDLGVALHLLVERFVERIHEAEGPAVAVRGGRLLERFVRRVDRGSEHVCRGLIRRAAKLHRLVELRHDLRPDRLDARLVGNLDLLELALHPLHGVALHPGRVLLLAPRIADVGPHRVPAPSDRSSPR